MRYLLLTTLLALTACATARPPVPDDAVRIGLNTLRPADQLSAYRLDGKLVRGLQFPDITPGAHRLSVRLRYETSGSAGRTALREQQRRSCILTLEYDGFEAGRGYTIVANQLGWQSVAWLENEGGEKLASATVASCNPAI